MIEQCHNIRFAHIGSPDGDGVLHDNPGDGLVAGRSGQGALKKRMSCITKLDYYSTV